MKNVFLKYSGMFIKGTAALLGIKMLILSMLISVQACQDSDNAVDDVPIENKKELQEFEVIAKATMIKFRDRLNRINKSNGVAYPGDLPPEEVEEMLEPMISSSVSVIHSYGITDAEIINEFGSLDAPELADVGLTIWRMNQLSAEGYTIPDFDDTDYQLISMATLFGNQAIAHEANVIDCALEAAGVSTLVELAKGGIKSLGKKGVMKLLKKVASRTLGPIGVAIAAYQFADCMGWLGTPSNQE